MLNKRKFPQFKLSEYLLFIFSTIFSSWLMFSTFSYSNGSMLIAAKAWSDFASVIPVVRSFSFGNNFPPQYPLFPGEPIHYHFLFFVLVGLIEKIGIRIDYALNILSSLGFAGLLIIIYVFAKKVFKSKAVGILSVIFFLFNGSFSFIEFFKTRPLSLNILNDIILNKIFPSFGPYDGKIVSAFWNLNIYTNQRHLAAAFFLSLLLIYILLIPVLSKKKLNLEISICLGITLGLFFFFHLAVSFMTIVVVIVLGILFKQLRIAVLIILLVGALISIPQYLFLQSGSPAFKPTLSIGYLAQVNLTLKSFIDYWFLNLGLHTIFIPLGVILAPKNLRKIFLAFFLMFVIGNTIQFSPEIAGNHKFFNYFMLIGVMFSAFALVKIWKHKFYLKPAVIILFFFLILSGIIDFFPIYNDYKITLPDYPINPDVNWIMKNTNPKSVFLNTQYLYDPASLAGRKIFLGWPYFPWSAGYDTNKRGDLLKRMLGETEFKSACRQLQKNNIDYLGIKIQNPPDPNIPPISNLYNQSFVRVYKNAFENYSIYEVESSCTKRLM